MSISIFVSAILAAHNTYNYLRDSGIAEDWKAISVAKGGDFMDCEIFAKGAAMKTELKGVFVVYGQAPTLEARDNSSTGFHAWLHYCPSFPSITQFVCGDPISGKYRINNLLDKYVPEESVLYDPDTGLLDLSTKVVFEKSS